MIIESKRQLVRIADAIVVEFNLFYRRVVHFSRSEFINDPPSLTRVNFIFTLRTWRTFLVLILGVFDLIFHCVATFSKFHPVTRIPRSSKFNFENFSLMDSFFQLS